MNRQKSLCAVLVMMLSVDVILVVWLIHRRSQLLAMLAMRSEAQFEAAVAVQTNVPVQSAEEQNDRRELGELRQKLEEVRTAVRRLNEAKGTQEKLSERVGDLFYPPEEPSLEEFRETQPEEYEAMKKSLAHLLRFAAAKKRLRDEYLARLDLSVLTEEERQTLLETISQVAENEDMFLNGNVEGLQRLCYRGRNILNYNQMLRFLRENEASHLAMAADWEHACDSAVYIAMRRAMAITYQSPLGVTPQRPGYIRGWSAVMIADPDAPEGKSAISVQVEPGWQP